jgi:hypothetical protein
MTAQEALNESYMPFDRVINDIKVAAANNKTMLAYILISPETRVRLRELGYKVTYPVGGGMTGGSEGSSTITWSE